jgi:hypothetical protein
MQHCKLHIKNIKYVQYQLFLCSTVEQLSTHNPKIKGLNTTIDTGREKMVVKTISGKISTGLLSMSDLFKITGGLVAQW